MFNDISPGNFDGPGLGFGGAKIHSSQATGTPIGTALPKGTPSWGMGYKEGLEQWYNHSMKISITTTCQSYRDIYLDLDPHYTDHRGQPLLRMTFNWKQNEPAAAAPERHRWRHRQRAESGQHEHELPADGR